MTHDPQMLKGVLSLLLLSVLAENDGYGYAIVTRLQEGGFAGLAEGTVYPALSRLETAGHLQSYLVRSQSGPARKYYRITSTGREELLARTDAWRHLGEAVATVTESTGGTSTHGTSTHDRSTHGTQETTA